MNSGSCGSGSSTSGGNSVQWITVCIRDSHTPLAEMRKFTKELVTVIADVLPTKPKPEKEFNFKTTKEALAGLQSFMADWKKRHFKFKFVFIVSSENKVYAQLDPTKKYHELFLERFGRGYNFFSTGFHLMYALLHKGDRSIIDIFRQCCNIPQIYAANRQRLMDEAARASRPSPPPTPPSHVYVNKHGMFEGVIKVHNAQSATVKSNTGEWFRVTQAPDEKGPVDYEQRFKQQQQVVFSVSLEGEAVNVWPAKDLKQGKGTVRAVEKGFFFLDTKQCEHNVFVSLQRVLHLLTPAMQKSCHSVVKVGEKVLYRAVPNQKHVGESYRALEVRPINALQQLYEQKCAQSIASKNTNNNASNYSTPASQPISNQYNSDNWPDAASSISVDSSIAGTPQSDIIHLTEDNENRPETSPNLRQALLPQNDGHKVLAAESIDAQTVASGLEQFFLQNETGGGAGDHFVTYEDGKDVFDADFEEELNRELEEAFGQIGDSDACYTPAAVTPASLIVEQEQTADSNFVFGSSGHSGGVSEAAYDKNPGGTSGSSEYGQLPPALQEQLKRIQQKAQQELAETEQTRRGLDKPPGLYPSQNNISAQSSSVQEHYEETMASALPPPGFGPPIVPETQPQSNQDPLPTRPSPQLPYTPPSIAVQSLKERVDWLQSEVEQDSEWLFEAGVVLEYAQLQTRTHEMFPELGCALFPDHA